MGKSRRVMHRAGGAAVLSALVALGGCAIHPRQDPGTVRIRSGDEDVAPPATRLTAHYVPYAILAAEAYRDVDPQGGFTKRRVGGPIVYDTPATTAAVARWMKPWRFEGGEMGPLCDGPKPCGLAGLEYQIWTHRRRDGSCDEAAVVFRGTDSSSFSDWMSNLHWVVRLTSINDQYEQVQTKLDAIIAERVRPLCPSRSARIVAVGHSLGGGLAQQAAFMSRDIRHVYAFDPSFVTGSTDRHSRTEDTRFGLKIDRVYEHGEILAYPRFVWRMIEQPTPCDPQIRTVRLNGLEGSMFAQHRIRAYVGQLVKAHPSPVSPPVGEAEIPRTPDAQKVAHRCSEITGVFERADGSVRR